MRVRRLELSGRIWELSELIVDFHVHHKRHGESIVNRILDEMKKVGVSYAVLLARDTNPTDLDRPEIRSKVEERYLTSRFVIASMSSDLLHLEEILDRMRASLGRPTTNQEVAEVVKMHPDRFVGFGSINLCKDEEYVKAKLREVDELNLRGLKLIAPLQFFNPANSENIRIVYEHFKKRRKIIMCHSGTCPGPWEIPELAEDANPKYLEPIVGEYDVPTVIAHFGYYSSLVPGIWFSEALKLGKKYANVWFDISAVAYIMGNEKIVGRIRSEVGMDRVLFGSDYLEYMGISVDSVRKSPYLKEDEKNSILGGNAAKLLQLKLPTG